MSILIVCDFCDGSRSDTIHVAFLFQGNFQFLDFTALQSRGGCDLWYVDFCLPEMHRLYKIGTFNMIVFDTFFCKANRHEAMNFLDMSSLKATRDISKKKQWHFAA